MAIGFFFIFFYIFFVKKGFFFFLSTLFGLKEPYFFQTNLLKDYDFANIGSIVVLNKISFIFIKQQNFKNSSFSLMARPSPPLPLLLFFAASLSKFVVLMILRFLINR